MAVLSALSVTLEVREIGPGVRFYTDAGLVADVEADPTRHLPGPLAGRAPPG